MAKYTQIEPITIPAKGIGQYITIDAQSFALGADAVNLHWRILEDVDLILVMSVNPGFGGQKFLTSQLRKIENLRNKIERLGKKIDLEVDGGINQETARLAISAGANVLVSGSYIFKSENYSQAIANLR